MIAERFYLFTQMIDGIHKCIHRLKFDFVPLFGVKSVHMFWIYELSAHPEGLTSAELASKSMISRSLVSRELERLLEKGYIAVEETTHGKRKNYNARITLTESGKELAACISREAMGIQNRANEGISESELVVFYTVLDKLHRNLQTAIAEKEASAPLSEQALSKESPEKH